MKQEPTQNNPNQWGKDGADIVERLRVHAGMLKHEYAMTSLDCQEAADEIERLRERCEAYKGQVRFGSAEIERLRRALEEYAKIEGPPYHGTPYLARGR